MILPLEDTLRELLSEKAVDAGPAGVDAVEEIDRRLRRIRLRRRVGAAAGTAVVIGGTVTAIVAAVESGQGSDRLVPTDVPSTVASPQAQSVSWQGVTVQVPGDWQINATHCGTPVTNTVIYPTNIAVPLCQFDEPKGITVVRLLSTRNWPGSALDNKANATTRVDAHTARSGRGSIPGTTESGRFVVIPDVAVVVTVSSPDDVLAKSILDSVTAE